MKYKALIIKMVLAMNNEDYLFKTYHFLLAKYRREKDGMSKCRKTVVEEQTKSVEIISHIDDLWLLNQLYRCLVNMTKDTKYEVFVSEKGGGMNDKEYYINRISEMIVSISNLDWLIKIYLLIKVFADESKDMTE